MEGSSGVVMKQAFLVHSIRRTPWEFSALLETGPATPGLKPYLACRVIVLHFVRTLALFFQKLKTNNSFTEVGLACTKGMLFAVQNVFASKA